MPSNICLLYHPLWGLSQCFLLLGRVIVSEWGFKPNAKAQVLAPTEIIWHAWTLLFQIWNGTITNAIIKNSFLFFLSPLSSFLSSFFFLLQTGLSLFCHSLFSFFLLSFSPLTHLYMIWRVERREVVDGFLESREKRDGGWVLDF